jgi:hypothetical protein
MFHIEVHQFPHSIRRFNMTPAEIGHLVEAWLAGRPVQLGERTWLPQQSRLTILEGPRLADHQLSMGRGWRTAQREAGDVTERILREASAAFADAACDRSAGAGTAAGAGQGGEVTGADTGVGELMALLGPDGEALMSAWRRAAERHPDRSPSETLSLAEVELAQASRGSGRDHAD